MNGVAIGGLIFLGILVIVAVIFGVQYILGQAKAQARERQFRTAMVALENKKAKALMSGLSPDAYIVDREMVDLRERYIAGKDVS